MTAELSPRDQIWYDHYLNFVDLYLEGNFSLLTKNMCISNYGDIDLEDVPGFVTDKVLGISVQLDNVRVVRQQEIVGGMIIQRSYRVAEFSGTIEYNRDEKRKLEWMMTLSPGQTLRAANIEDLYQVMYGDTVIFQLKEIDEDEEFIVIGPIKGY